MGGQGFASQAEATLCGAQPVPLIGQLKSKLSATRVAAVVGYEGLQDVNSLGVCVECVGGVAALVGNGSLLIEHPREPVEDLGIRGLMCCYAQCGPSCGLDHGVSVRVLWADANQDTVGFMAGLLGRIEFAELPLEW